MRTNGIIALNRQSAVRLNTQTFAAPFTYRKHNQPTVSGVDMSDQNLDYAAIRRKVEMSLYRQKRVNRIIYFLANLFLYVVTMIAIWTMVLAKSDLSNALFRANDSSALLLVILPTILWGTAVLFHFISMMIESGVGEKAIRERLLMREVGEEILRKGLVDEGMLEKPKRRAAALETDRVLLSDDGELVPVDEDNHAEQTEQNSGRVRAGRS